MSRGVSTARLAAKGELFTSWHRALEVAANAGNFHLWPMLRAPRECPCCGFAGKSFIATANWRAVSYQSRCPQCDSRSRHRGLVSLLGVVLTNLPEGKLLFFAPERTLMHWLEEHSTLSIATTDYHSVDVDYPGEDIQRLSFSSESFAAILCNHVLEHVPNDRRALLETARVLKPGGVAVFTIPGDYHLHATRHFDTPDGNGHFRHYGLEVVDMMQSAFSRVETIDMGLRTAPKCGVRRGDLAFICRK